MTFTPTAKTQEIHEITISALKLFNIPISWQNELLEAKSIECQKGKRINSGF